MFDDFATVLAFLFTVVDAPFVKVALVAKPVDVGIVDIEALRRISSSSLPSAGFR